MAMDREKLLKVNQLASQLVKEMVRDGSNYDVDLLKNAVENLSRSLVEITNIQLGKDDDSSTTLQATISKVKIAYNSVSKSEKKMPV